jgi:hypothetical protein
MAIVSGQPGATVGGSALVTEWEQPPVGPRCYSGNGKRIVKRVPSPSAASRVCTPPAS